MKCYQHTDRDAVGICRSCGNGGCVDCFVDLGRGLACQDRCVDDVKRLFKTVTANINIVSFHHVFFLIFGVILVAFGWLSGRFNVSTLLGLLYLLHGGRLWFRNRPSLKTHRQA